MYLVLRMKSCLPYCINLVSEHRNDPTLAPYVQTSSHQVNYDYILIKRTSVSLVPLIPVSHTYFIYYNGVDTFP